MRLTPPVHPVFQGLVLLLQCISRIVGYFCACYGWFIFIVGTFGLVLDSRESTADVFRLAGVYIAPGWLLLRLSAGLFPFGKYLYKQ